MWSQYPVHNYDKQGYHYYFKTNAGCEWTTRVVFKHLRLAAAYRPTSYRLLSHILPPIFSTRRRLASVCVWGRRGGGQYPNRFRHSCKILLSENLGIHCWEWPVGKTISEIELIIHEVSKLQDLTAYTDRSREFTAQTDCQSNHWPQVAWRHFSRVSEFLDFNVQ